MENKEETNIILSYSAMEQSKNGIMGPGRYLMIYLGIFPFVPLLLALFSCFVKRISSNLYRGILFGAAIIFTILMVINIVLWVLNIMRVYIIDEKGYLYRIKISTFWYKVKDKMYLINPMGNVSGRLMRLFYMINNIKTVLSATAEDITYEDFIAMGRMDRISDISDVVIKKKCIRMTAHIENKYGKRKKKINIKRIYEKDIMFCEYLKSVNDNGMTEEAKKSFLQSGNIKKDIIKNKDGNLKKFIRFTVKWTSIMCWIAVFTISSDLSRLSMINSNKYVESVDKENREIYVSVDDDSKYFLKSDYGKTYKPVIVMYISVEIIYAVMKLTDGFILKIKKN